MSHVAVVGWGSLPWQPTARGATLASRPVWHLDGPRFPVEFARVATDSRLTLIVLPGYPHEVTTLWTTSTLGGVAEAVANLAAREGAADHGFIHGVTLGGDAIGDVPTAVAKPALDWLAERDGVDAAIWTGFDPGRDRWGEAWTEPFVAAAAVKYLDTLQGHQRTAALAYIRNAPPQTDTPVRRLVAASGLLG